MDGFAGVRVPSAPPANPMPAQRARARRARPESLRPATSPSLPPPLPIAGAGLRAPDAVQGVPQALWCASASPCGRCAAPNRCLGSAEPAPFAHTLVGRCLEAAFGFGRGREGGANSRGRGARAPSRKSSSLRNCRDKRLAERARRLRRGGDAFAGAFGSVAGVRARPRPRVCISLRRGPCAALRARSCTRMHVRACIRVRSSSGLCCAGSGRSRVRRVPSRSHPFFSSLCSLS